MAIGIPSGFRVTAQEPIDTRLVLTKAEMQAKVLGEMPLDYYLAVCNEKNDHRVYIYDSSLPKNGTTGRFRPLEDYLQFDTEAAQTALEKAINNSPTVKWVISTIGSVESEGTILYNINKLKGDVDELQSDVDTLKNEVGDSEHGLIYQVNNLEIRVDDIDEELTNDLEPRVQLAEENITTIESWINHVKLDGGEIKAVYNLIEHYAHLVLVGEHPTTVNFKKSVSVEFANKDSYVVPDTVTVSGVEVGSEEIVCGFCKAKWVKNAGETAAILTLSEVQGDIEYSVIGVEK